MSVHSSFLHVARNWKQPKCPLTDDWKNRMGCVCIMEHYSGGMGNELLILATIWRLNTKLYAKRRKADTKGSLPYGSIPMKFQKSQSLPMVKETGIAFAPGMAGLAGRGHEGTFWGNRDILFLPRYVSYYTGARVCPNRSNRPLKIWAFHCT